MGKASYGGTVSANVIPPGGHRMLAPLPNDVPVTEGELQKATNRQQRRALKSLMRKQQGKRV